jgi:hypothetical protein
VPEERLLVRAYARKLLDVELSASTFSRGYPTDHEPLLNYVRSTNNRRVFCFYLIAASMDEEPVTPSYLVNQLGVSRNAVDTMIQECESNNWIIVDRDERDHRTMYSTDFMVEVYMDYASWISATSQELGLSDIQAAVRLLKTMTK